MNKLTDRITEKTQGAELPYTPQSIKELALLQRMEQSAKQHQAKRSK